MKLIRVAAAVTNQTPLDWQGNQRRMSAAIADARRQGASVLCLPELCITGYNCEDAFYTPGVESQAHEMLRGLAVETQGMIVAVGLPLSYRKALFNAVALLVDGRIAGFVPKRYLAGDGLYYEPRWFRAWDDGIRATVDLDGTSYPVGDLVFVCDGVRIGFEICEDAWVARRPGGELAMRGVDLILNPSASHFAFGKHEIRRRFVLEGSRAYAVGYVYANHLGVDAGRAIYDGGALIAAGGDMITEGPRFGFHEVCVTSAVIDFDLLRMQQKRTASFRPELGDDTSHEVHVPFRFPALDTAARAPQSSCGGSEPRSFSKEEAFSRAITLALFDYMRKSRSRGFVVSLSGGVDSAAVVSLVCLMVRRAIAELGIDGFRQRLSYIADLEETTDAVLRRLLLTVYQATRNSGDATREAAAAVARGTGATHLEVDVDDLFGTYVDKIADAIGRDLTWERDDITLQNIQARVRLPSVWMLANLRGALLLATSNRSEAAVGYTTMDGDTGGGLSPIAGIDKAFLRIWLRWLETQGADGHDPIPELAAVNRLAPTAELRPPGAHQTDEDDLMPYDLLEAIERAAIRDKQLPLEVHQTMRPRFPDLDANQLATYVERFFRLWSRNQWKRERYAPSFHVDDENLDPKTWCRFPILSGGFDKEIAEMWRAI
ncbi:MAG: NAD(+) synthase [Acidobacteriota bacterium]